MGSRKRFEDKDWFNDKKNDCGCKKDFDHDKCSGCVCDELRDVAPGTTIFLTIDGVTTGPFIFASFCKDDCCVTLVSGAAVTPSGSVFVIDCNEIDAISFPPATGGLLGL
ncbi:hypothetical protein [Priestia endophytica]|uniref:hypothetical protein n=1 Tax=Priestia endophytica TaxID=135735 RepID=UPI00124DCB4B|nr:hypothetical protein [Priestia endophytica]KAB2488047.1 hypothetical protein F8155_25545 [Priestia endophytica]MCM3541137.1 hypothetical protein [Priestia endophytica]